MEDIDHLLDAYYAAHADAVQAASDLQDFTHGLEYLAGDADLGEEPPEETAMRQLRADVVDALDRLERALTELRYAWASIDDAMAANPSIDLSALRR